MLLDTDLGEVDFSNVEFIGEVVDNNDPLKLGRIKVKLPIYPEDVSPDSIPWCCKKKTSFLGGGTGIGSWSVPEIGSFISVKHLNGDPHSPYYDGEFDSKIIDVFGGDPNLYGMKDSNNNYIKLDKSKRTLDLVHEGKVTITQKGDVIINLSGNRTITIDNNENVTIKGDVNITVNGSTTLTVDGSTTLTCDSNTINGPLHVTGPITSEDEITAASTGTAVTLTGHVHPYIHCDGGESSTHGDNTSSGVG